MMHIEQVQRGNFNLSDSEKKFICSNKNKLSVGYMAKLLGRSRGTIKRQIRNS